MHNRSMARNLALLLIAFASLQAEAVNKCTSKDGKVIYQDAACGNSAAAGERVKTWENSPGSYFGVRETHPNEKLQGPSQAAPMLKLYRRWIDAERLALSTGRIALSGPVASLQTLQREIESLDVISCLSDSKLALVALTTKSTITLLQFMQKDELSGMVYKFLDRPKLVSAFEASMENSGCK